MLPRLDPLYPRRTHRGHNPFFPTLLRTPTLSHRDATLQAARELTHALQNLNNANLLSQLSDDQLRALHQLSMFSPPDAPGVETNPSPSAEKSQLPSPHIPTPYILRPLTSRLITRTTPESASVHSTTLQPASLSAIRRPRHPCRHRQIYGIPRPPGRSHHMRSLASLCRQRTWTTCPRPS